MVSQYSDNKVINIPSKASFNNNDAVTGNHFTYGNDLMFQDNFHGLYPVKEVENEQMRAQGTNTEKFSRKQNELFEGTPDGYFALNSEGIIQEVNQPGANLLGMSRTDLENQSFAKFVSPEDQETFHACWFDLMQNNTYQSFKLAIIKSGGKRIDVRISLSGTEIIDDFYILLAITDISLWKQADEEQSLMPENDWSTSGKEFLIALTEHLGRSLEMDYVSICKLSDNMKKAEVVFSYHHGQFADKGRYRISDTAFKKMLNTPCFCFPNNAYNLFPNDKILQKSKAESYAGVTLFNGEGKAIGLIQLIGYKSMMETGKIEMTLKQVAVRASKELEQSLGEVVVEVGNDLEKLVQERTTQLQKINKQLHKEIIYRKRQEQLLKAAQEKYRTIADFTFNWETWLSPEGKYIYVSPSCQRISGYSVEEFMEDPSLTVKIAHPEDQPIVEAHFAKETKGEATEGSFDFKIITKEGYERWIGHHCQPVYDPKGNFIGQRGSNRDITQRKTAENILLDSQKYLRQLSQRMEEITEAERTRIAREIHDELGHLLTALKYDIEGLINQTDLTEKDMKTELGIMIDMVDSLIDSVRRIATELRPGILDHLGLFPAIEWQIRQFRLRTKICCVFTMEEMEVNFDRNETNIIFRILQEILTNITKHSEAKHVKVGLVKRNGDFMMEVTDNGIGFKLDNNDQKTTFGLIGMKERALSIGGEIQIDSQTDHGTTVRFLLPKK